MLVWRDIATTARILILRFTSAAVDIFGSYYISIHATADIYTLWSPFGRTGAWVTQDTGTLVYPLPTIIGKRAGKVGGARICVALLRRFGVVEGPVYGGLEATGGSITRGGVEIMAESWRTGELVYLEMDSGLEISSVGLAAV